MLICGRHISGTYNNLARNQQKSQVFVVIIQDKRFKITDIAWRVTQIH